MEIMSSSADKSSLWHRNAVVVQLLGLSPVLAVSTTFAYGLGLALATLLVITASCVTVSLLRNFIEPNWRLVYYMMIIAFFTSLIVILLQITLYPLYRILGIYLPLICCNAGILHRMECYASRNSPLHALGDALQTGLGFLLVIVSLGALREWLSYGSVLADWHLLLLNSAIDAAQESVSSVPFARFQFTLLQPGALICLGLLVALKNALDRRFPLLNSSQDAASIKPVKRVRVTGKP
jgi:Na+-translocating ferredoxin:NAD+ oxidoreductase subunit E